MTSTSTPDEPVISHSTSNCKTQAAAEVSFSAPRFRYDPFPIGTFQRFLPADFYDMLTSSWPELERFAYKKNLGAKYSLSEVNNRRQYFDFIRSHEDWRSLYELVKAPEFSRQVIKELCDNSIDLGLSGRHVSSIHEFSSAADKIKAGLRKITRLVRKPKPSLTVRFEFSMLPAAGGHIKPHTDSPQKLITLVLSMVRENEWDQSWGGGTEVLKPKDITRNFNFVNKQFEFDDVETLDILPFEPNQCAVFVKTFNSFHSVSPMTGPDDGTMRKTLTINIECWE